MLHHECLGTFDRDRHSRTEPAQLSVEPDQAGNVRRHPQLGLSLPAGIDNADLVVLATPVDPGEHRPLLIVMAFEQASSSTIGHRLVADPSGRSSRCSHERTRDTTPTGRSRSATAGRDGSAAGTRTGATTTHQPAPGRRTEPVGC